MKKLNKVVCIDKKLTADGWRRKIYSKIGKKIVLTPVPCSMVLEKKTIRVKQDGKKSS